MFSTMAKIKLSQATHLAPALCHALNVASWDRREEPMPMQSKFPCPPELKQVSSSKNRGRSPRSAFSSRKSKRISLGPLSDPLDDPLSLGDSSFALPFSSLPMTHSSPLLTDLPSLDFSQDVFPMHETSPRPFLTESAGSSFLDAEPNGRVSPDFSIQVSALTNQFEQQQYFRSNTPTTSRSTASRAGLLSLDSSRSILNETALRKLQQMYKAGKTVGVDGGIAQAAKPPPPTQDDAALAVARSLVKWSEGFQVVEDVEPRLHYRAKRSFQRISKRPSGGFLVTPSLSVPASSTQAPRYKMAYS